MRARSGKPRLQTRGGTYRSCSVGKTTGGQGVHREVESEGHAENCRAVVEGAIPLTNRSAKGGARSSLHYGGEGVTHPPTVPRCVRTARQGRSVRDPRRTHAVPGRLRDKRPYKRKAKWEAMPHE
jgi:hypothetical protein